MAMFLFQRQNGVWYIGGIIEDGKERRISTGTKIESEARIFLRDYADKGYRSSKKKKLSEFLREVSDWAEGTVESCTRRSFYTVLREFMRIIGDKYVDEVGVRDVDMFLAEKSKTRAGQTVLTYHSNLRWIFSLALKWGIVTKNPCLDATVPRVHEKRVTFFEKNEIIQLLNAVDKPEIKYLVLVGFYTGMRLGEITRMRWEDIDMDNRSIVLPKTKAGRVQYVTISDPLVPVLSEMRVNLPDLFNKSTGYYSHQIKKYIRKAGLRENLSTKALRHAFGTHSLEAGMTLREVQEMMRHSSTSVTEIYTHVRKTKHLAVKMGDGLSLDKT